MKKKIIYTDEDLGEIRRVEDFLPPPEFLVFKKKTEKITLELTDESVQFFKKEAKKYHTQYQKMIRNLLDHYVACFKAMEKKPRVKKSAN